MAKQTFYFSHDYNARNDEKILELRSEFGAEGYGIFWMLVETMAENDNSGIKASLLGGLSLGFGVAKDILNSVIGKCLELKLFHEEDGYYFSNRLLSHKEYRKTLSENGKKGAGLRWGSDSEAIAPLMQSKVKESKLKEIKEKNKKKKSAVFCDLELGRAYFTEDGTVFQELGVEQKKLLEEKKIKYYEITEGDIF
jgi:hypothetical protein